MRCAPILGVGSKLQPVWVKPDFLCHFAVLSGKTIPYAIKPRRAGDIASCYAKTDKAEQVLGWRAQREQDAMCADTWRWQQFAASLG